MGKYINDINKLYAGLEALFTADILQIKKAVLDTKIVIGMNYTDPEGQLVVDASGDDIIVYTGTCPPGVNPLVSLELSADTGHLYWLGKVNFMLAMQKGEIKTKGDLGLVLKLVPVLGPLFKAYAEVLKQKGMDDLLV